MPAQDLVLSDHAMAPQRSRQPPHERGEHGPVRPVQAWTWVGAAQNGELVTQHPELDVLRSGRAAHQEDQSEHLQEDQGQQPQRYACIMSGQQSPQVGDPGPSSGTPHRRGVPEFTARAHLRTTACHVGVDVGSPSFTRRPGEASGPKSGQFGSGLSVAVGLVCGYVTSMIRGVATTA